MTHVVRAEVVGVLVAVDSGRPITLAPGTPPSLPSGPLLDGEPSLQASTRAWVAERTGVEPGYLEQLYTFADAGRPGGERVVSVSYLGLVARPETTADWRGWYEHFPWEDRRPGSHDHVADFAPRLSAWAECGDEVAFRRARVNVAFGLAGAPWLPSMVLQRYELLYEAGMIPEAPHAQGEGVPGLAMTGDHRRILATGLARLRAKIEYRPVVFELLPDEFTLTELQRCVEALAGQPVHTQNFRRTVETQQLVEETGGRVGSTGGRPAKLFRFRREIVQQRSVAGTKLPVARPS